MVTAETPSPVLPQKPHLVIQSLCSIGPTRLSSAEGHDIMWMMVSNDQRCLTKSISWRLNDRTIVRPHLTSGVGQSGSNGSRWTQSSSHLLWGDATTFSCRLINVHHTPAAAVACSAVPAQLNLTQLNAHCRLRTARPGDSLGAR